VDQQRADLSSAIARAEAATAKLAQMESPTGREYEIAAQQAMVAQARAGLAQAEWQLSQRRVSAPVAALVSDTYARPGETIGAGVPVVSLLPPQNILVRFFVPETELASLHVGDRLSIGCDACAAGLTATITFIAPQPEYTPPVIYSETNREKLVYLIEAHPPPDQAVQFKPGQPVDVRR
jgi:HlyD family secretion protein